MSTSLTDAHLDGHDFTARPLGVAPDGSKFPTGSAASCSCGWEGDIEHALGRGAFPLQEADEAAAREWQRDHVAALRAATATRAEADAMRAVVAALRTMIDEDRPLAALDLIRIGGGEFSPLAREAALRATYLDNSWTDIGRALGISRQAAWEKYGKR
ncbi:hypothetical protein GCM10010329_22410 [Streptomyces spiroverticillatus]|uniref:Uncharacterized protein n=1 Tax=Streptomyces finlayi TaxID=67296 RepID=A0A918WUQ2_9ACTN|nr:hypothetical protein [Streptomyces finlayi]GHA00182.1 hypothetical protein GCM10010329_22410 [Streptomyces spiroverticillatus]GHC84683.1 hypothetical protein GCM10010334_14840 [Streptomyces finlayi]